MGGVRVGGIRGKSWEIWGWVMGVGGIWVGREILGWGWMVIMLVCCLMGIVLLIRWVGRYCCGYVGSCGRRFGCVGLCCGG